jgi:hypothetical protein
MAFRVARPALPRIDPAAYPTAARAWGSRKLAHRPASRDEWSLLTWRLVTLPYWAFSDVPRPQQLPARNSSLPNGGLAGEHVVASIDSISRRIWLQWAFSLVARGAWLGILVGCFWLIVEMLGGPALDLQVLSVIGIVLFVPSLIVAALIRPTRRQTAWMLDCSFGLQERITTALDNLGKSLPREGKRAQLTYLQVADAANAAGALKKHPAFAIRPPVREIVLAITFGLIFAAFSFLRGGGGSIPPVQSNAIPVFIPAAERFIADASEQEVSQADDTPVQTAAEVQELADLSNQARQDLLALADALSDHAVTRSISNMIAQSAYDNAAQSIRDLGQRADQLTEAERESLASDLEGASANMSSSDSLLAQAAQEASTGLTSGGQEAQQGLENLGDAVEETARAITSQSELDQQMQQARSTEQSQGSTSSSSSQSQASASGDSGADQQASQMSEPSGQQQATGSMAEGAQAEGSESGQQPGSESGGSGSEGESQTSPSGSQEGEGAGQSEGQMPGGSGNEPGASSYGESQAMPGIEDVGTGVEQGTGAGGNADIESERGNAPGEADSGEPPVESSDTPEQDVTEAAAAEGEAQGPSTDPRQAISLGRSPEGESIQIPGSSGGSMRGTGAGVTVSGGSATQGAVGESGPDSNHVPAPYRPIVESYFSDPDGR